MSKLCNIVKTFGVNYFVSSLVSTACLAMEIAISDNLYCNAEPQSLRNVLEWFFLDRRYRFLKLLNGNEERFTIQKSHGKYITTVEVWDRDYPEHRDASYGFRTHSEKEVIRVLENYTKTISEAEVE